MSCRRLVGRFLSQKKPRYFLPHHPSLQFRSQFLRGLRPVTLAISRGGFPTGIPRLLFSDTRYAIPIHLRTELNLFICRQQDGSSPIVDRIHCLSHCQQVFHCTKAVISLARSSSSPYSSFVEFAGHFEATSRATQSI